MEALNTCETSVNLCEITLLSIQEDSLREGI
jgi:hypothetical protein